MWVRLIIKNCIFIQVFYIKIRLVFFELWIWKSKTNDIKSEIIAKFNLIITF